MADENKKLLLIIEAHNRSTAELNKLMGSLEAVQKQTIKTAGGGGLLSSVLAQTQLAARGAGRELVGMSPMLSTLAGGFTATGIAAAGLGAAAVAALVSIANKAQDTKERILSIADASEKLYLSFDTIIATRVAAIETRTEFGTLINAFGNLRRVLGDADRGSTQAAAAFNEIKVATRDATGQSRSFEEVQRDVFEAFRGGKLGIREASVAMQLFGRSGQEVLGVLRQGGDFMARMKSEASGLGIKITDVVVKSLQEEEKAIKKSELAWELYQTGAERAISAVWTLLKTQGTESWRILLGFNPPGGGGGGGPDIDKSDLSNFNPYKTKSDIAAEIAKATKAQAELIASSAEVRQRVVDAANGFEKFTEATSRGASGTVFLTQSMREFVALGIITEKQSKEMTAALRAEAAAYQALTTKEQKLSEIQSELIRQGQDPDYAKDLASFYLELGDSADSLRQKYEGVQAALQQGASDRDAYIKDLERIAELERAGAAEDFWTKNLERHEKLQALARQEDFGKGIGIGIDKLAERYRNMGDRGAEAVQRIGLAVEDGLVLSLQAAINSAGKLEDKLRAIAVSFFELLQLETLRLLVQAGLGAAFGALGVGGPPAAPTGPPGGIGPPAPPVGAAGGGFFAGGLGPMTGFASGGIVKARNPLVGIIGEGPNDELVLPVRGGMADLSRVRSNGGGGDVIINIGGVHLSALDTRSGSEWLMGPGKRAISAAVTQAIFESPALAAALARR